MEEINNIQAALRAGQKLAAVQSVTRDEGEKTKVIVKSGFNLVEIDNDLARPVRKKGTKNFDTAKSFCSYVNKHKSEDETVIIAHESTGNVKAILNDDGEKEAAWSDFCALLKLGFSKQWLTWFENAHPERSEYFSQSEFADFIEDNRSDLKVGTFKDNDGKDVKNLSALELSAVITNLQMTFEEKLASKIDPVSGQTVFSYQNEEVGNGSLSIPKQLFLAIPIYKSGDLFQVVLRLRHRMQGGSARFYMIIDQVDLLKEKAFDMICQRITDGNKGSEEKTEKQFDGTGIEVLKGSF